MGGRYRHACVRHPCVQGGGGAPLSKVVPSLQQLPHTPLHHGSPALPREATATDADALVLCCSVGDTAPPPSAPCDDEACGRPGASTRGGPTGEGITHTRKLFTHYAGGMLFQLKFKGLNFGLMYKTALMVAYASITLHL